LASQPDGLPAYVDAIERHFCTRRGAPHTLTPRDFALARSWFETGIPLASVLVGVDLAFDADPNANSLAFCRRRVEELAATGAAPLSAAPSRSSGSLSEIGELLALLRQRLLSLDPEHRRPFTLVLVNLQEVEDLVAVSTRPNWEYLSRKLREIDEEVSAAVMSALSPEEATQIREQASRAVARHQGRVDAAALDQALARFAVQRARERLGLPRVASS
jgi:Arc/MetJ family transcription regulator